MFTCMGIQMFCAGMCPCVWGISLMSGCLMSSITVLFYFVFTCFIFWNYIINHFPFPFPPSNPPTYSSLFLYKFMASVFITFVALIYIEFYTYKFLHTYIQPARSADAPNIHRDLLYFYFKTWLLNQTESSSVQLVSSQLFPGIPVSCLETGITGRLPQSPSMYRGFRDQNSSPFCSLVLSY